MKNIFLSIVIGLLLFEALISCNKKFDKVLSDRAYIDSTASGYKAPKVLLVIVDGARGQSMVDAQASTANINTLIPNATYSWYSLSDTLYNDASSWTDMLTGVGKEKHKVVNNTFIGNKLGQYPLVFQRIKLAKPNNRIAAFSNSIIFNTNLTAGTDVNQTFTNDQDVKSAVVSELGNDAASLVVGEFGSVNAAGSQYGYDYRTVPQYASAILQFDSYLGEMLAAVRQRKNYAKEDWLIIVTSSRGGPSATVQSDGTPFTNSKTNTFTIFSNLNYKVKYIDKPYVGTKYIDNFVRLYNTTTSDNTSAVKAVLKGDSTQYNFGLDTTANPTQYTIELKVKTNGTANNGPAILSREKDRTQSLTNGWDISLQNTNWQFTFNKPGATIVGKPSVTINDGIWHHLSVVIYNKNFLRYFRLFTDGKFNTEIAVPAGWGTLDSKEPVTLGSIPGSTNRADVYVSDVRFFRAALPDSVIAQFACNTNINSGHPYYRTALAGYWPCNDGSGGFFKDFSPYRNNFVIVKNAPDPANPGSPTTPITSPAWTSVTGIVCPVAYTDITKQVPGSKDITAQILSWFAIPPADSWGLDGRVWLNF